MEDSNYAGTDPVTRSSNASMGMQIGRINQLTTADRGTFIPEYPKGTGLAVPEVPGEVSKFSALTDSLHEEIHMLTDALGSILTGPTDIDKLSGTPMPGRASAIAQNLAINNDRLASAVDRVRALRLNVQGAI